MIIKCVKLLDDVSGENLDSSDWLTVDKTYLVLSVYCEHGEKPKFQTVCDDGITPALHLSDQFQIVSDHIPTTWCARYETGSHFELLPRAWAESEFWEKFFDGDDAANKLFKDELEIMLAEEKISPST